VCTCRCSVSFLHTENVLRFCRVDRKCCSHSAELSQRRFLVRKGFQSEAVLCQSHSSRTCRQFYSRNTDMVLCSSEPPSEHTSEPGPSSVEETDTKVYCYCQSAERGTMVGCDNPECVYEWFHLECLKLSYPPKGRYWYCPDCRKIPEFRQKTAKKQLQID